MNTLLTRKVRRVLHPDRPDVENSPQPLANFIDHSAWVLLGEPGAGKTEALKAEAKGTGGLFIEIADFIHGEIQSSWRNTTLFLDGLDEVRAGGDSGDILRRVRARLKDLGHPRFRLSCRAADWYGVTDMEDLSTVSPNGSIEVLLLEALTTEDTETILKLNLEVTDPQGFVTKARDAGLDGVLGNPQMLELLVRATGGGHQWPKSREFMFELACNNLSQEPNKRHRNRQRNNLPGPERVLDAAGHLCAVLLLSNSAGIAFDSAATSERYVALDKTMPPARDVAMIAMSSNIFRGSGDERMAPAHRSIAEYLAARWLAQRVDKDGLPLGRVTNLLLGRDGRSVAGLRGLYAWLAYYCRSAREHLIESDPLTVVIYGDARALPLSDKRNTLRCLQRRGVSALIELDDTAFERLGDLAAPELEDQFLETLSSPKRDDDTQARVVLTVDILLHGDALPSLAPTLLEAVRDDSRWPRIRTSALRAWLKLIDEPTQKLQLLEDVRRDNVTDRDDELLGVLLSDLYPSHLQPEALLTYLHVPKDSQLFGSYLIFWIVELPVTAPLAHVPVLLDALAGQFQTMSRDRFEQRIHTMVDRLLVKGIECTEGSLSHERLFAWLGIGADNYGAVERDEAQTEAISKWFDDHPDSYKGVLEICYERCRALADPYAALIRLSRRLEGAPIPKDLGRWHLDHAGTEPNEALAREHLETAADLLVRPRGSLGLSLEDLFNWADAHRARMRLLSPLLVKQIPDWRREQTDRKLARQEKRASEKTQRTLLLTPLLGQIEAGSAPPHIMHELAGVWMQRFSNIPGETIEARFDSYTDNGERVIAAARLGFQRCLERTDLPNVESIIELSVQSREHFLRLPCLLGVELTSERNATWIEELSTGTLERLIAFQITAAEGRTPTWFSVLLKKSPAIVASVLVTYAVSTLRSERDFVSGISTLSHDDGYSAVAALAAPQILRNFPAPARLGQLSHLENLLKAALRYAPESLQPIVDEKLADGSLDVAQTVCWHAAGMLLSPELHEERLWQYVGNSEARIAALSSFLVERHYNLSTAAELSPRSIGKLIELLTPHAEVDWPRSGAGSVTPAMQRGDHVRALIARLGTIATDAALIEIERLLTVPLLAKLRWHLERARHDLTLRRRENEFRYPSVTSIAEILSNRSPVSAEDLASIVLDQLDQVAIDIRAHSDDRYRPFWTEGTPNRPKKENSCRDFLLTLLRPKLEPLQIDCATEGDYVSDKRADISVSFQTTFRLPIEIKRDSHRDVWTAVRDQLIRQYTIDPRTGGHGIYIVLWFGEGSIPAAVDGGKKPTTPAEFKSRLESNLAPHDRARVFIRVIDVSWPEKRSS